jgi:hypothetical protein
LRFSRDSSLPYHRFGVDARERAVETREGTRLFLREAEVSQGVRAFGIGVAPAVAHLKGNGVSLANGVLVNHRASR